MLIKIHTELMMISVPLLLSSQAALGGLTGIDVKIINDGTENIVVTVYDTSTQPNSVVLAHERINGFSTVPVTLVADAAGRANLSWTAITANPNMHRCGHASNAGLNDADSVNVHADSECVGT